MPPLTPALTTGMVAGVEEDRAPCGDGAKEAVPPVASLPHLLSSESELITKSPKSSSVPLSSSFVLARRSRDSFRREAVVSSGDGTLWEGCVELMGGRVCVYRGAVCTGDPLERVPVGALGVDSEEGAG